MKKTLLLCFIHGFKGGDDTFGDDYQFTHDLRARVAEALPKIDVKTIVYPRYETHGDLGNCVSRFRDWLLEKVIDLEVAARTPSPTIDPSVRLVLIGHSMGGIVAAETALGLATEKPIYSEDGIEKSSALSFNSLMFPYIQAVLAFDTPFLGISPGVVARNAEEHYASATAAYNTLSSLWASPAAKTAAGSATKAPVAALPAPASSAASSGGSWANWGKVAMYAGAAGAIAAGGATAWYHRENITQGMSWVGSHLEFVGCLARAEELKKRVSHMVRLNKELDVGFGNLYTRLGQGAPSKQVSMVGNVLGPDRTFCNLPSKQAAGVWKAAVNSKAKDEITAHMNMFDSKENPEYQTLINDATSLLAQWLQNEWYASSKADPPLLEDQRPS